LKQFYETRISRAILAAYQEKLSRSLESDVLVVGAGPAGLLAAYNLARQRFQVTVVEKRLTPGGGIWGGGMGMNDVVLEPEVQPLVDELGVRHHRTLDDLCVVDAMELASALCLKAMQAGAILLNLLTVEDVCVLNGRVAGVVVNRTMLSAALPIDPLTLIAQAWWTPPGMTRPWSKRSANGACSTRLASAPMPARVRWMRCARRGSWWTAPVRFSPACGSRA
jgi:thiamine thiazole synthase